MNSHVHGAANDDLVITACKKVIAENPDININYSYCVSSLRSDPRSRTSDIYTLGVVSYEQTTKKAKLIISYINKLLKDPKQSPGVRVRLEGCKKDYTGTDSDMDWATWSFEDGDYPTAEIRLEIARAPISPCQQRFDGGYTSPLTEKENEFMQQTYISLVITDMKMVVSPPP
ncbi:hypothetical protein MKX03_012792 [Papaver bracteatum]|nr:hypothetical protein MKX03_012792 [Papaver bracteatum]